MYTAVYMKIALRVTPKAKQNRVIRLDSTHYKIWVTAAPEQGKATAAAIKLLSAELGIAPSLLSLISGATSRNKLVEIE